MCSFIENDETNYYLYYYDNNSLKVLECMQKYDLANYVNSYSNNFKPGFDIIGGYINYLKETLNFDPIPKEINIDNLKPSVKEIILTYLDKKKIQDYKIYIDSKNQIFAISGTAIIKYNSKTQEMYFLKSEDIFKNTLNEDTTDYDNIPYLLPFEIDKDRVDTILDNIDTLSSYDKRYLNSVIKTLIEKPDLVDDDVLELGLTPNRSDMLSMLGVGYEVSACFDRPLKLPIVELEEANDKNDLNVRIDTDKCLTYHAKLIKNIKIRKSPDWLISRLIAFGIRPINNAVDITNYILALYGQPLHAFDAQKLGKTIVIRNAKTNEEIVTLDGNKRVLEQEDIVITDGTKPVAIAGVMGGLDTEVENTTKDIVLEVAVFDPISIRKTYKRLDLRSEAAIRYEKGIDRNRVQQALKHACKLFKDLCDAEITSGDVYQGSDEEKEVKIELTSQYISNYLGITITNEEILSICKRLQFETTKTNDVITVTVPSRRKDVSIKADMVEEIGRIHGYEKLPTTLPYSSLAGKLTNYQTRRKQLKHKLCSLGLTESINYSLRENNNSFTYLFDEGKDVELIYPISNERKVLRRSLLPSLLENVSYVFNRKIKNAAFYEIGKVYYQNETGYIEEEHLAIALSGVLSSTQWKGNVEEADFFTLKGIINSAMQSLGITLDYEKLETIPEMHPLRTAKLISDGKEIGFIGYIQSR